MSITKLIALIDDELEMEEIFRLSLEQHIREGLIKLKYFSRAGSFLDWLPSNVPDLILTDISLPDMDGPELISRTRKTGHNTLTYFMSGYEEDEYRNLMQELEVDRYLSKPLNLKNVTELILSDLGILADPNF